VLTLSWGRQNQCLAVCPLFGPYEDAQGLRQGEGSPLRGGEQSPSRGCPSPQQLGRTARCRRWRACRAGRSLSAGAGPIGPLAVGGWKAGRVGCRCGDSAGARALCDAVTGPSRGLQHRPRSAEGTSRGREQREGWSLGAEARRGGRGGCREGRGVVGRRWQFCGLRSPAPPLPPAAAASPRPVAAVAAGPEELPPCTTLSSTYRSWRSCRCRSTAWRPGVSRGGRSPPLSRAAPSAVLGAGRAWGALGGLWGARRACRRAGRRARERFPVFWRFRWLRCPQPGGCRGLQCCARGSACFLLKSVPCVVAKILSWKASGVFRSWALSLFACVSGI